jgi:TonB family protein
MFSNLIESSSHAREFKRRSSFVLFTSAVYALLFIVAGVTSIYAYDARLNNPDEELELISYVPPQADAVVPEPVRIRHTNPPAGASEGPRSTRPVLFDNTSNPLNAPRDVSAIAPNIPPAHVGTDVGSRVMEPGGPGGDGGDSNYRGNGSVAMERIPDPPPVPIPAAAPPKVIKSPTILNGLAVSLPKPVYPPFAKQGGIQGSVNVQVLVDETGRVVSAKAVTGSPTLMHAAQEAAMRARFSPTKIGEQAVKVSGVITYNFILQ